MSLALRILRPVQLRGALSTVCTRHKHQFSTSTSFANDKLYELRRYKIRPEHFTNYLNIAKEKYEEVMMPHGRLMGYWSGVVGGLNEVQHLWEYDDYAHRDDVVRAKREDKRAFGEYISHALPMLITQEHTLMRPFPWYTPQLTPCKWGVYELVTARVKPGMMSQLEHRVEQGLPARLAEDYPPALGFWYSEFGNANLFIHLWPHESLDKRDEHRRKLFENNAEWRETWRDTMKFIDDVTVQGMSPLPFSPLQ